MQIKVSELSGIALDWAVAKAEGFEPGTHKWGGDDGEGFELICNPIWMDNHIWSPSTDWSQGGSLIERESIAIMVITNIWQAVHPSEIDWMAGPTPLIAAMRCYVASKLGDAVDVPDELMED